MVSEANKITRLINFIVDKIGFLLILKVYSILLIRFSNINFASEQVSYPIGYSVIVLYFLYHFLFEYLFRKTPGKFITHTIVVNKQGGRPAIRVLLLRNFIRIFPFEFMTYISGSGWHDAVSETTVLTEKRKYF
jgi:uncharacterized RDD family membrane protein YckC